MEPYRIGYGRSHSLQWWNPLQVWKMIFNDTI